MKKLFKKIYSFIDKNIIIPISRMLYYLNKKIRKSQGAIDKILNKTNFLIYLSLALAVALFLFIDSKVISLVETEAEIITNVPVKVKYNEEAYVVEGVPKTVDITIAGRKSDIYLAKQLGEYEVVLDLSEYSASSQTRKVYFTYPKSVNNSSYKIYPPYAQVSIKNKESNVKTLTYDLLNIDHLNSKLSVKSVSLNKAEVVVKGSNDALDSIASVKALIDLAKEKFHEAGTFDVDNIPLVCYDSKGQIMDNVEIVPKFTSATIILDSYAITVPVSVETTGKLLAGKAIASILINGNTSYSLTIYGEKNDIDKIKSVPVTINIDGLGEENTKSYTVKINKPTGVRNMSDDNIDITATFGEEKQKTVDITKSISHKNLAKDLKVNIIKGASISVQVKGVQSVIENITEDKIRAYLDLNNLGVGEHEVEVKIENTNPLLNFVVSGPIKVNITK